jgi:hypothetical protein
MRPPSATQVAERDLSHACSPRPPVSGRYDANRPDAAPCGGLERQPGRDPPPGGKGADVNVRTKAPRPDQGAFGEVAGATPLAIVARDRQIAGAATLCALGADPDLADANGASARQVAARVAAEEGRKANPIDVDLLRHRNMAAFLAKGASCDALLARRPARREHRGRRSPADRERERVRCRLGLGLRPGGMGLPPGRRRREERREGARALPQWLRDGADEERMELRDGRHHPRRGAVRAEGSHRGCPMAGEGLRDTRSGGVPTRRLAIASGLLYAAGSGVTKDLARARALFKRACDQKHEKACANLAKQAGGA